MDALNLANVSPGGYDKERWRGGRAVQGDGLLNRDPLTGVRGFESHPLRQFISHECLRRLQPEGPCGWVDVPRCPPARPDRRVGGPARCQTGATGRRRLLSERPMVTIL